MTTRAPFTLAALALVLLACANAARAQERDAPKAEVGVQYSSLSVNLPGFRGTEHVAGFGGRVTYNFNDYFAVEAEGNLHPSRAQRDYVTGGASQQMQFGVKAGKRWRTFGVFAKARPGFVSFGETLTPFQVVSGAATSVVFDRERKTHFSMDVGGVVEFYPSRRVLVRFDVGDTLIRFGEHPELQPFFGPGGPVVVTEPSQTTHNFQFTGGVGFRFGGGGDDDPGGGGAATGGGLERRFEVGAQFSSLVLRLSPELLNFPFTGGTGAGSRAEAGFGGRVGFNATDSLAFEAEGNFYPRRRFGFDATTGGYPAQMQFGVKYGRRHERFGLFAKARPGFVTFSSVTTLTGVDVVTFEGQQFALPNFEQRRQTYFSMDLGGVLEFYPSSRVLTRFDFGDTMIRYPERELPGSFTGGLIARVPSELRHNFQFTGGVGFRF
ncbi:MAG TPA: outer membrane beta-barrel protein [Pyrinomonadaceae bacterium]|jgi:hypothetical protein